MSFAAMISVYERQEPVCVSMADNDSLPRVLVALGVLVLAVPLLMMVGFVGWGTYADGHMGSSWMWMLIGFVPLVVLAVLGYVAYRALTERSDQSDPAMKELRRAYARGDITDEEFQTRTEMLESDR